MRYPKRGIKRNAHPNGGPKQDDGAHDTTSGVFKRCFKGSLPKQTSAKTSLCQCGSINAMSELVMNTLRGAVRPGRKTVPKLRPYSKQPRLIASPRQSIKRRRKLMIHQLGSGVWSELKHCYHCAQHQYRY